MRLTRSTGSGHDLHGHKKSAALGDTPWGHTRSGGKPYGSRWRHSLLRTLCQHGFGGECKEAPGWGRPWESAVAVPHTETAAAVRMGLRTVCRYLLAERSALSTTSAVNVKVTGLILTVISTIRVSPFRGSAAATPRWIPRNALSAC